MTLAIVDGSSTGANLSTENLLLSDVPYHKSDGGIVDKSGNKVSVFDIAFGL